MGEIDLELYLGSPNPKVHIPVNTCSQVHARDEALMYLSSYLGTQVEGVCCS